jgi:N-acetylglucosamine malate deacetylase 2
MPVEETLTGRRVVLVAAHPDDETVGAGGLLPRMRDPLLVHVTDGAPRNLQDARAAGFELREDYAQARRLELLNALALAGIRKEQTCGLNVCDQEASRDMADLAHRLAALLQTEHPAAILTHPYEGGHPDHDATAFAVHAACALIPAGPEIYEFTSYHARESEMEVGRFLISEDPGECMQLPNEARQRKRRMIECFSTQQQVLRLFPLDVECFRTAPSYNFTQAPHPGTLWYERFAWGMTGERWRQLAAEALRRLGMAAPV